MEGRGRRAPRIGFTLAEVIAALLIVAVIASFVIPTVFGRGKAARVDAIVAELTNVETGIMLFRSDIGRYPGKIEYLAMTSATGTLTDGCGTNLLTTNQAKFRGPYISRSIVLVTPPIGGTQRYVLPTGDSVDTKLYYNATSPGTGFIQIIVRGPELDIAQALDAKIDGVDGASTGKLQFGDTLPAETGSNIGMEQRVTYSIPIRSGTC